MFICFLGQLLKESIFNKISHFLIVSLIVMNIPGTGIAAGGSDEDVLSFFSNLEKSFLKRDFSSVVRYLHKDFTYLMTYITDDKISFLESDANEYRKNVGSFFLSKPNIYEYSVTVEDIQRIGGDIMVLLRIKSVVELYNIVNTCEASSNYHLQLNENHLLVKDVRGDATCFNTNLD